MVKKVKSKSEFKSAALNAGDRLVVVVFGAKWCGPCKRMLPFVDGLAERYKDRVRFIKVDVDEIPKVADKYDVSSLPTYLFLRDGREVYRVSSADEDKLKGGIKKHK